MEKTCPECSAINVRRFTCYKCHEALYPRTQKPMSEDAKRRLREIAREKRELKETFLMEGVEA